MSKLSKKEIAQEFGAFLDENGLFLIFESWIEKKGIELSDLEMEE